MISAPLPLTALVCLLLGTTPPQDKAEEQFLGAFRAYVDARDDGEDIEAAWEKLEAANQSVGNGATGNALGRPDLMGRAASLAFRPNKAPRLKPGNVRELTFGAGSFEAEPLEYCVRLPRNYEPGDARWPVVLSLPDVGQSAEEHLREHWTDAELLGSAIFVSPELRGDETERTRVVVDGRPGGLSRAMTALRLASDQLDVDPDRIVLVGVGAAAPAAFAIANFAPQRFAGLAIQQGDADTGTPQNLLNLGVYLAGKGGKAAAFKEASEAVGNDRVILDATPSERALAAWILDVRRRSVPDEVRFAIDDLFINSIHWLRLSPIDPLARVQARIHRDTNELHVDAFGASAVTVYLTADALDLSEPIQVHCNGAQTEVRAQWDLKRAVEMILDGTSDPGCVYVAELVLSTAGEPSETLSRRGLESPLVLEDEHAILTTTLRPDTAKRALEEMKWCVHDLERALGARPEGRVRVAILRNEEQYDRVAMGDPDGRRPPRHGGQLHVIHNAFFAESWFVPKRRKFEYRGSGVGIWDTDIPSGDAYGRHSAKLAFALAFVDAVDPSPKAIKGARRSGPDRAFVKAFDAEKLLPAWLRFGAAVYAERYFKDDSIDTDARPDANLWWARDWSLENLQAAGGMGALGEVLEFDLDPKERDHSRTLLLRAGALVAFALDGGNAEVTAAHQELVKEFGLGRLRPKHVRALEEALERHQEALLAFTARG